MKEAKDEDEEPNVFIKPLNILTPGFTESPNIKGKSLKSDTGFSRATSTPGPLNSARTHKKKSPISKIKEESSFQSKKSKD